MSASNVPAHSVRTRSECPVPALITEMCVMQHWTQTALLSFRIACRDYSKTPRLTANLFAGKCRILQSIAPTFFRYLGKIALFAQARDLRNDRYSLRWRACRTLRGHRQVFGRLCQSKIG
jgi:hypothetical protein